MAELTTTKPVNVSQLCVEMGRIPLRSVGPNADGVSKVATDAADQATLEAAVAAHVADPNWTDPNPPPPTAEETREKQLQDLRTKAKAVWDGTDTFTSAQVQKIVAGLVLKFTRA